MSLSHTFKKIGAAALVTASLGAGAVALAAPASAASPHPEIAVTAQTGPGTRAYIVTNEGNTTIPAGTQFTFKSNSAVNVGLFGNPDIKQDWNIGVVGSGNDVKVRLKNPIFPGQTEDFQLSKVEVSAFSQSSFALTDVNTPAIDTNYQNNRASIQCTLVLFGLPACSVS